jgi:hypothetical protein
MSDVSMKPRLAMMALAFAGGHRRHGGGHAIRPARGCRHGGNRFPVSGGRSGFRRRASHAPAGQGPDPCDPVRPEAGRQIESGLADQAPLPVTVVLPARLAYDDMPRPG